MVLTGTWPLDPTNRKLAVFKGILKELSSSGVITRVVTGDETRFGEGVEGDDERD